MRFIQRLVPLCLLLGLAPFAALADPVNINTADAATIAEALEGVGEAKARAIVAYRQQHGPFKSVDELGLVKGIGPKMLEHNRANIRIDRVAGKAAQAPAKPAPATVKAKKP
jgi:competence protein ComEA